MEKFHVKFGKKSMASISLRIPGYICKLAVRLYERRPKPEALKYIHFLALYYSLSFFRNRKSNSIYSKIFSISKNKVQRIIIYYSSLFLIIKYYFLSIDINFPCFGIYSISYIKKLFQNHLWIYSFSFPILFGSSIFKISKFSVLVKPFAPFIRFIPLLNYPPHLRDLFVPFAPPARLASSAPLPPRVATRASGTDNLMRPPLRSPCILCIYTYLLPNPTLSQDIHHQLYSSE